MCEPYNTLEAKFTAVESIPLNEAVLCVDCNCITRARNGHCLVCGSHSVFLLAKLLDERGVAAVEPLGDATGEP